MRQSIKLLIELQGAIYKLENSGYHSLARELRKQVKELVEAMVEAGEL